MEEGDRIEMSLKDLKRHQYVQQVIEGKIKQKEAAELLDLCDRQVRRLQRRVEEEGVKGVVHRLRGKPSGRSKPEEEKQQVLELCRSRYVGFGPTLAQEKLLELNQIDVVTETLRLWFIEDQIEYKKRKERRHRQRRERKPHFGEMVQADGSHHDWFEGRGPKCVLMGFIDDATGRVFAMFYEYEGTMPVMDCFWGYIKLYGMPMSLYLDKHSTYRSNAKLSLEEELEGQEQPLSEFERAMKELEVNVIHANSPQAKGRVERLFGTFQDRVIKEMRLKNVASIEEANRFLKTYLPIYNKRFSVKAVQKADLHRKVPRSLRLDRILCLKTSRTVRNDFTVAYNTRLFQITVHTRAKKVFVLDKLDGTIEILYEEKTLPFKPISARTPATTPKHRTKLKKVYVPPADNLWKMDMAKGFKVHQYQQNQLLVEV